MRRRVFQVTGALLLALGLTPGPSLAQQTQTAPAKGAVEVTYYYLPG